MKKRGQAPPTASVGGIMSALGAVPLAGNPPPGFDAVSALHDYANTQSDLAARLKTNDKARRGGLSRERYEKEKEVVLREAALRLARTRIGKAD